MAWKFLRIRTHVARFEDLFRRHYGAWSKLDFRGRSPDELLRLYREMEEALLWNWKAPIVNDFFVMIFYGTLRKLCRSWCGDATESLQNDLLSAQGGIESAEPVRLLLKMAATARQDPVLLERLRRDPPDVLTRELPADPRFAPFVAQWRQYLDAYGLRCMDELKLEEPPLRDRPGALFEILRNYLDLPSTEPPTRPVRETAEARAFAPLGFFRRRIFRMVLTNARLGVRNRENLRLMRTRVYGLLRDLLRALGARFAKDGVLEKAEDVFYLTLDELWDFVKGTAVTTDLRGLVSLRRKEVEAYRREDAPADRFETVGVAYLGSPFRRGPAVAEAGSLLRGTGGSPGEVEGTVIALRTPPADLRLSGQILAAERTDPGWVVFFPCISGLLVERGSLLSHSCIVARELGIPTIVKIPGLLGRIASGRRVRMNGSDGTVRILDG
jgi:pyruvate,water dikinase